MIGNEREMIGNERDFNWIVSARFCAPDTLAISVVLCACVCMRACVRV